MPSEMPEGIGPTSWWQVWGEIKGEFASLRSDIHANRQRTHDLMGAVLRRQDDMRRETTFHIARIDRNLEVIRNTPSKGGGGMFGWISWRMVTNTVSIISSILGTMGLLKPEWVKILTGLTGLTGH